MRVTSSAFHTLLLLVMVAVVSAPSVASAQRKNTKPLESAAYHVALEYPKKDWVVVPAAGGNIALVMHKKGEASLALDYQVLRVSLAPDEIDETFQQIEVDALTQRAPHSRVTETTLSEMGGHKVVIIHYGAAGPTGDLDVTQYSIVEGSALYRLTCAVTRATLSRHGPVCDAAAQSIVISPPS